MWGYTPEQERRLISRCPVACKTALPCAAGLDSATETRSQAKEELTKAKSNIDAHRNTKLGALDQKLARLSGALMAQ